jgi:3',5'-nucleoside bisphosphate phosphatase
VIDLHLHTTASDGQLSPSQLVDRVAAAGVTVMAVTDHDTVAAIPEVTARAAVHGIEVVTGIEITAVEGGRDIHVLGYFVDPAGEGPLSGFLTRQRASRLSRVEEIGRELEALGMPIETSALLADARGTGRSIGRPQVARAMIAAGYVTDIREAFDKWLGTGCPAFVPRVGPRIETVIDVIHSARGLASLAHPGRSGIDDRVPLLSAAGLDALEVHHSDHDAGQVKRYGRLAQQLSLLVTGGSDFHAEPTRGIEPGTASLPAEDWARLRNARERHARRE